MASVAESTVTHVRQLDPRHTDFCLVSGEVVNAVREFSTVPISEGRTVRFCMSTASRDAVHFEARAEQYADAKRAAAILYSFWHVVIVLLMVDITVILLLGMASYKNMPFTRKLPVTASFIPLAASLAFLFALGVAVRLLYVSKCKYVVALGIALSRGELVFLLEDKVTQAAWLFRGGDIPTLAERAATALHSNFSVSFDTLADTMKHQC